ncbi:PREDICTED: cuticle collagen 13-like [Sturnus vulgaris]|uniref:cuticle collagen 13-like n=1 Tax=Sturnus vulgaris TaxID=9172 RepID=UPI00071A4129|nr:PREDICTED: cuticle collagen 13-like [Sturnus vulgaris]
MPASRQILPSVTLKCAGATLRSKRESPCAQQGDGSDPGSGRQSQSRAEPRCCGTRARAPCDGAGETPRQRRDRARGSEPAGGLRARPGPSGEIAAMGPAAGPCRDAVSGGIAAEPCWGSALPCPRLGPAGGPGPAVRGHRWAR